MAEFGSSTTVLADLSDAQLAQGFGVCEGAEGLNKTSANLNAVLKKIQDDATLASNSNLSLKLEGYNLQLLNGFAIVSQVTLPAPESAWNAYDLKFQWTTTIQAGWALCDGSNGTPDMRGAGPIGFGPGFLFGATIGTATHDHGGATDGHQLTRNELPRIADLGNGVGDQITQAMFYGTKPASTNENMTNTQNNGTLQGLIEPFGGDELHAHQLTPASSYQPSVIGCWVMKLPD